MGRTTGAWLAALALLAATGSALSQTPARTVFEFDIPGQPLVDALETFSRTTGRQVAADGSTVRGIESRPVTGRLAAREALERMTRETGLAILTINGSDFALRAESGRSGSPTIDSALRLEEVVVYGTKQNASLQDTVVSASVFNETAIEEQILFEIQDVFLQTPNVSTQPGNNLGTISIRGIEQGGVGRAGIGNTSNIYLDGSPLGPTANLVALNLWDVQQVEVLRGPQSTIQGRNALAGAVIIQTADPSYEFGADIRGIVGNEEQRNYSATVNVPLIDKQVAIRLAADHREFDYGVTDIDNDVPAHFQKASTLRGKLLIEPEAVDSLRIELNASYTDSESGLFNLMIANQPLATVAIDTASGTFDVAPLPNATEVFDPFGGETFAALGEQRLEFNDATRLIAEIQYEFNPNWSFLALGTWEEANRFIDGGSELNFTDQDDRTLSGELRAIFDYDRLRGWVGAYHFNLEGSQNFLFSSPFASFGLPTEPADSVLIVDSATKTETTNSAVFFDLTYDLNDNWSINLGARWDEEEFDDAGTSATTSSSPADCVFSDGFPGLGGLPCAFIFPSSEPQPLAADFSAFLPRASVTYNIDPWRSLSFAVQRGYRSGGSYFRAAPGEAPSPAQFDPEFLTNYELAMRSVWLDERLRLNANMFYSDWDDQQVEVPGPSGTPFDIEILNAGVSEIYGLEIMSEYQITPTLRVFGSLGMLETEFTDFPFAVVDDGAGNILPINPAIPDFANLSGNRFPAAPRITASVGASYASARGLFWSVNAGYTDGSFSDITNLEINEAESFTIVNARAGYKFESLKISLFANNLLDDRVIASQNLANVSTDTGLPLATTAPAFTINDPRLIGIEVRVAL